MPPLKPAILLGTALLCACAKQDTAPSTEPLNKYSIHGEIIRLSDQDKTATIHHKDIDGFMKSMTMTFPVKDPKEFAALQPGNCVDGNLFEQGDSLWLANLQHLDLPADECVPPVPAEK